MQRPLSKIFLLNTLIIAASVAHAMEVKPFKFIKNNEGYPENIALYKITNKYSELYVKKYPFSIENSNRNSGFLSEIDPQCETLEKIYKQQQNTYVVTSTCGAWFGMSSPENHYFIYEFNDLSKLVKSETIEFKESLNITISELNSGIKITSTQSPTTGKKYNFEYKNGNLYDFSTSMNRNLVSKESDRVCKGFYDQVYTEFKYSYVPGMTNLFEILPRHAYSWVPNKIKSSEELSDKLANDLKGKDLTQRRNVPYSRFKQDYCS